MWRRAYPNENKVHLNKDFLDYTGIDSTRWENQMASEKIYPN